MKRYTFALFAALWAGSLPADDSLSCHVGPIQLELGGTPWQVTSCDDDRSLVFATTKDNPAVPFFFFVYRDGEASHITGEGTGSKKHTDAAFAELEKMSETRFDELVQATKDADVSK